MPNINTYIPTYINLTLNQGYIAIYNNLGVQKYYQNTDELIELPYTSPAAQWSYKIAKHGYKLVTGVFSVDPVVGGTINIDAFTLYVQDTNVANTSAFLVSAYNTFSTTQDIYDYLSYYRTTSAGLGYGDQNSYTSSLIIGNNNIVFCDTATPAFSYNGSTYTLNSLTLSGASITTTGTITLSGNSSISNITLAASALDNTPNDLTNVIINGMLIYNTNTPASIVYTNCTVGTVVNNGTATVLIKRVNSSINNAADPEIQNYAPTLINVTPNGGSVGIYDNSGNREYFITSNSSLVLPSSATGTWSFKVAKYGYYAINENFVINSNTGSTVAISPFYVTDLFLTETNVAVVSAYTDLTNAAMVHDYLSYNQTLSSFIDYGDLESEAFGSLTFVGGLTLDATAANMVSVSANVTTLKSTNFSDSIILVAADNFTQANGNTISDDVKIRSANYDSELYFGSVNSVKFYTSQANRDTNTYPKITLTSPTIYRYKYGGNVDDITFVGTLWLRIVVGSTTLLVDQVIASGSTRLEYGQTGTLQTILNNQRVINEGVQKASILVPHSTNI